MASARRRAGGGPGFGQWLVLGGAVVVILGLTFALGLLVGRQLARSSLAAAPPSASEAARKAGARRVIALVTHGLFMPGAAEVIADPAIERIVVTDTVPPFRLDAKVQRNKIDTLPVAPVLADAIRRLHHGQALTDLMVF